MNRLVIETWSLVIVAAMLTASVAYPQCTGRFCYPVDPWSSAESSGLTLNTQPSTLNPSSHVRIFVGDGTSSISSVGSGTLIGKNDETGLVLTCSHLFDQSTSNLGSASNIIVEFPDGGRFGARLVDCDAANDLAALLIQTPAVEPIEVCDDEVPQSAQLTACGYGGNGIFRPARGIVAGAAQAVGATFPSLKIRSAVRPGDSGGGVLDYAGRLVGVVWGCRDGETYLTCGRPLRDFLHRIRGERASARGHSASSPTEPVPSEPTIQWQAWRDDIDTRLAALDAKKQDRGDYLQPGDLNAYAKQSDLEASTHEVESLRTTIFTRIKEHVATHVQERIATLNPGPLGGLSVGKLVAGALGLSGPVALAVIIASTVAGRRLKRRLSETPGSSLPAPRSVPIAVDSPPPPQQTIPESHYVPVQKDDFARAHQWAREQVARKYPGATEVLTTLESLIKQQLAGSHTV
jgi:hypothetical protein